MANQIKNFEYKAQIIEENAEDAAMTPIEYIESSVENDPTFFRWLFNSEGDDFECPNEEAFEEFKNYFL